MLAALAASAIDLFMIRSNDSVVVSGVKPSGVGCDMRRRTAVYEPGPLTFLNWQLALSHLSQGPWMTGLLIRWTTAPGPAPAADAAATTAAAAATTNAAWILLVTLHLHVDSG